MNYDDENEIIEQENKGQQKFDPIGAYQDVKEMDRIGKRINDSKLKNKNDGGVDVAPKTGGAEKAAEEGTKKVASGTAGTEGVASGGVKAAEAGANAAKAGSATSAATTGSTVAAGSAGAAGGATAAGSAAAATPVGLIIIGVIVVVTIIFLLFIAVFLGSAGNGMSIGTGADENIWSFTCEEGDDKCEEVKQYLRGEYSGLEKKELYDKFLELCDEKKSFGKKIADFFSTLLGTDEYPDLETTCDLAQLINKYVTDKEKASNVTLSRGLVVATIQWLYENVVIGDNSEKNSDSSNLNTSSPNDILENILKNGMINARDVKSIVDYMVFDVNYTFYNWQETYKNTEYDCITNSDGTKKCKTLIKYGCEPLPQNTQYASPEKYFYFLRFGGSFIIDNNKLVWNTTSLKDSKIIIKDKYGNYHPELTDFATSYQEIKNFNDAYNYSSDFCKIEGLAKIPESTADVIYELDTSPTKSVNNALEVLKGGLVNTEAYNQISLENIANVEGSIDMPVVKTNCNYRFNNGINSDSIKCVEIKPTSYFDGFIYRKYPKYTYGNDNFSTPNLTGKGYNDLVRSIEGNIEFIDSYEEFLNDIFGFGEIVSYNEQCIENIEDNENNENSEDNQTNNSGYKIRLETCIGASESEKASYRSNFPGGWEKINGNYVAKNTISLDDYIKGVTVIEFGRENMTENKKEALKFQLIAQKSYFLSSFLNGDKDVREVNGEIRAAVGSHCTQNFGNVNNLKSTEKEVLDSAYATTKNAVFYKKGTEKIDYVEYGAKFTNNLINYAISGLNYEQMLDQKYVRDYDKEKKPSVKWYEDSIINTSAINLGGAGSRTCSEMLIGGGIFNGNVNTKWPFFPSNVQVGGSQEKKMFICRKMDNGRLDFHGSIDLSVPAGTTVTSPLSGEVISSNELTGDCMLEKNEVKYTVNAVVQVKAIIPGTGKQAVMQFTHLNKLGRLPVGAKVEANKTILGIIGFQDGCSSGTHLDFKVYEFESKRYYNPSVFIAGILSGSQNIPTSSFTKCTTGGVDVACYDKCCKAAGLLPICGGGL